MVAAWEARLPASVRRLSDTLTTPRPDHPFAFFHLRKTGGTGLRHALHTASVSLGIPPYIACHGAVPCETYSPPLVRELALRYAVVGGHFDRGRVMRWLEQTDVGHRSRPFGCLVMPSTVALCAMRRVCTHVLERQLVVGGSTRGLGLGLRVCWSPSM